MRRFSLLAATVLMLVPALPASADAPAEFGTDWDDPRTAVPPIERPDTPSCEVVVVDYEFRDFTPFEGTYTPPADCPPEWSKVVLRMTGAVAGRQFDRLGHLEIGGVPIFKTSTPQPSPDGIEWTVESDVTEYASLLETEQPVWMLIGNVVNDTYTGILDVQVSLEFYGTSTDHPAAEASDLVRPLADARDDGAVRIGSLTVPRNSRRLMADVYATGSGGGCEEFWYLAAPSDTGYWCAADEGPYRDVRILIDGEVAGIAAPFPHVYTGGWSNPFLWYVLPAPRAFDIRPLTYDLTPYLAILNDGESHEVRIEVQGVPAGQSGWAVPTGFRVWTDPDASVITGTLVRSELSPLRNEVEVTTDGADTTVTVDAGRRHTAVGRLRTSSGVVTTSVTRRVGNTGTHTWGEGEWPDALDGEWTESERVLVFGAGERGASTVHRTYRMDGRMDLSDDNRLTTVMRMSDAARGTVAGDRGTVAGGADVGRFSSRHTYAGAASWTVGVPREERHAVGMSAQRYTLTGTAGCYDRDIATRNGFVTSDRLFC